MDFSTRLKKMMKAKGISDLVLADQCGVGFTTVRNWLSGKCLPSTEVLVRLSNVLGVSVDALLGNEQAALAPGQ